MMLDETTRQRAEINVASDPARKAAFIATLQTITDAVTTANAHRRPEVRAERMKQDQKNAERAFFLSIGDGDEIDVALDRAFEQF